MPIEQGKSVPVKSVVAFRSRYSTALVNPPIAVISIYASSIETGSTSSVYVRNKSKTAAECDSIFFEIRRNNDQFWTKSFRFTNCHRRVNTKCSCFIRTCDKNSSPLLSDFPQQPLEFLLRKDHALVQRMRKNYSYQDEE